MGILMIFHMINFKGGTLMTGKESKLLDTSLVQEPLHFFTSLEIDADDSQVDESNDKRQYQIGID